MKRLWEDFVVTGFGTATSYAVAFIMWFFQEKWDLSLYSFSLYFIPIGAFICGIFGSIGYYFGSKLFDHRPSKLLLIAIVIVAASTYFLIYWVEYDNWEQNGVRLRNHMDFFEYLDKRLRNIELTVDRHGAAASWSAALEIWGYAYGLLQVVGFSFGGLIVFEHLSSQPYCENCGRYLAKGKIQSRTHPQSESVYPFPDEIGRLLEAGEFQAAITHHAALPNKKVTLIEAFEESGLAEPVSLKSLVTGPPETTHVFTTEFSIQRCPGCTMRLLRFSTSSGGQVAASWQQFTDQSVEIP